MSFASVLKPVKERISIPIDGTGVGGIAITPAWTLLQPLADETPRDIAFETSVIFGNTTLVSAPEAYTGRDLSSLDVLVAGLRGSCDIRGADQVAAGRRSALQLFQPSQGSSPGVNTIPLATEILFDQGGAGVHQYNLRWGSTTVSVANSGVPENAWFRIGFEIIPEENVVRGYYNVTAGDIGEGGNTGLLVRAEIALDNPGTALIQGPFTIGVSFSNASSTVPSNAPPNFCGVNDILIELFPGPTFLPVFPGGSPFEVGNTPYAVYKRTLNVHTLLNNARIA